LGDQAVPAMSHSLAAARLRADRLEFETWYVRHPAIVGIREILGARISASDGARNVVTRHVEAPRRYHDAHRAPEESGRDEAQWRS
jgi:hypothetical protein